MIKKKRAKLNNTIDILNWDSNFFNNKICRINGSITNVDELSNILIELSKQDIDLAYYSSPFALGGHLLISKLYSINLVDRKTTYVKKINQDAPFHNSVIKYASKYPNQKLLDLSVQSGVYSRFKVDNKIGRSKYEELYKEWITNSVNKKIAKEVLVYLQNEIAGFVTLGEKNSRADIGIIAVDEHYRGKGIGKGLMLSAEKWFANYSNFTQIQVVTQGDNAPACKLFESCGYKVDKVDFFYHLWRK